MSNREHRLNNRLKKAFERQKEENAKLKKEKKKEDAKMIVSKGVLSQLKEDARRKLNKEKSKVPNRTKNKELRKILKQKGFENIKIIGQKAISAKLDGQVIEQKKLAKALTKKDK